jgi:hypothetical protein
MVGFRAGSKASIGEESAATMLNTATVQGEPSARLHVNLI